MISVLICLLASVISGAFSELICAREVEKREKQRRDFIKYPEAMIRHDQNQHTHMFVYAIPLRFGSCLPDYVCIASTWLREATP